MVSKKSANLLDAKFKMYFFLHCQTDLLLVLDIQYQPIHYLQIKDQQSNLLYTYNNSPNTNYYNEKNTENSSITPSA